MEQEQTAEIDSTLNDDQVEQSTEEVSTDTLEEGPEEQQSEKQSSYARLLAQRNAAREEARQAKEEKEALARQLQTQNNPELQTAIDVLKENGFVTKAEIEAMKHEQQLEQSFSQILAERPELKIHEQTIRDLAKLNNIAPEDVIEKYPTFRSDKLSKAKESRTIAMGNNVKEAPKARNIKELDMRNPEDRKIYQDWANSQKSKQGSFAG